MPYQTLLYDTHGALATITLNRPERLNTIVPPMPDELESAVREATADAAVKVIVLRGAGRAFCAGFDFAEGFHHWDQALTTDGAWDPGKDLVAATSQSLGAVEGDRGDGAVGVVEQRLVGHRGLLVDV